MNYIKFLELKDGTKLYTKVMDVETALKTKRSYIESLDN